MILCDRKKRWREIISVNEMFATYRSVYIYEARTQTLQHL